MATKKNGVLTPAGEWWKHLRWTKRAFWKGERQASKKEVKKEAATIPLSNRSKPKKGVYANVRVNGRLLTEEEIAQALENGRLASARESCPRHSIKIYNPMDYGAVGDGKANDTHAFKAIMAEIVNDTLNSVCTCMQQGISDISSDCPESMLKIARDNSLALETVTKQNFSGSSSVPDSEIIRVKCKDGTTIEAVVVAHVPGFSERPVRPPGHFEKSNWISAKTGKPIS